MNRRLKWTKDCMEWERDPKHVEIFCKELGSDVHSKGLTTPSVREMPEEMNHQASAEKLVKSECTTFTTLAARANYLA